MMRPRSSPARDRLELILLRWLGTTLALVDGLFNVRWRDRVLGRLTERWQAEMNQLEQALTDLREERLRLNRQMEAIAIHTAVIYLAGRQESRNELRFDPADPRDERLLDACIDTLVKERLATIESEESQSGSYIYTLEPDWSAIRGRLAGAADVAQPELADWLREGIRFIDGIGECPSKPDLLPGG